jgi:hypothetical protein
VDRYDVIVNGVATTLLLSAADAAARGLTKTAPKADAKAAPAPANKSRKPANKVAGATDSKDGDD